ncbi:transposable element Tc1 transposase [Trichonephila clavipes]|nr:transposable element Tc1 transposase [Trichonephila clavipes]
MLTPIWSSPLAESLKSLVPVCAGTLIQAVAHATRGLMATDHEVLNHGQVTWTTPELAPSLLTTTPHQRVDVSSLDRCNVNRCPTRRVFSGTGFKLVTRQATIQYLYHSATVAYTSISKVEKEIEAATFATLQCLAPSGWNHADWRSIVFSDESCFQLYLDDHRRRVWRRRGLRVVPDVTIARHTGPQPGVMVRDAISFDPFEDKSRPHAACVAMQCLTACQTLSWSARLLDVSPIEHARDMMGKRLHLLENVDGLAQQLEQI